MDCIDFTEFICVYLSIRGNGIFQLAQTNHEFFRKKNRYEHKQSHESRAEFMLRFVIE